MPKTRLKSFITIICVWHLIVKYNFMMLTVIGLSRSWNDGVFSVYQTDMQHWTYYQPLLPAGNKYLQQKWDKASYDIHRRKVWKSLCCVVLPLCHVTCVVLTKLTKSLLLDWIQCHCTILFLVLIQMPDSCIQALFYIMTAFLNKSKSKNTLCLL